VSESKQKKIIIIGAGFSGMGLAIHLQKAGIRDFAILEKADEVGGTWRENHYPGAECDIASALYSYSFEHNADWQYKWAEQPQIFDYLKGTAKKYNLYEHIHFATEVASAIFDEQGKCWRLRSVDGEEWCCQFLVAAVGQLHHPFTPEITGQSEFKGAQFHSARWQHDVDLSNKHVAVVGNAASALQFIPQIAPEAAKLTVFQRGANWVIPKLDRPYAAWEQWLSARVPLVASYYRFSIWLRNELLIYPIMQGRRLHCRIGLWMHRRYINKHIDDPVLRAKLTPDYPMGAKRILVSDDYYAAMARSNVELEVDGIAQVTERGITTTDGRDIPADVIIYGTGFKTNPFLAPMDIRGVEGRHLRDAWRSGAQAYLGMMTSGFPNLFMLYGPNTNLGHNSIVIMAESQARYICEAITALDRDGHSVIEVKAEAEQEYNSEMQLRLAKMAWNAIEASWYKDGNKITNNWPGSTYEYIRRTRGVCWDDYRVV
jgi:cation diffusion facilitator CzcD-associated flavoprotein CzcO